MSNPIDKRFAIAIRADGMKGYNRVWEELIQETEAHLEKQGALRTYTHWIAEAFEFNITRGISEDNSESIAVEAAYRMEQANKLTEGNNQ